MSAEHTFCGWFTPADLFAPPFDHLRSAGLFKGDAMNEKLEIIATIILAIVLVAVPMLLMPSDAAIMAAY